jgi:hypothetical protein
VGVSTGAVVDWWRRRRLTTPRIDRVERFEARTSVPDPVRRHTVAVVERDGLPMWAIFECPCGNGHTLLVNLSRTRRPAWSLTADSRGPSLAPSIDFADGKRRCHFWLQHGRARFTPDSTSARRRRRRQI